MTDRGEAEEGSEGNTAPKASQTGETEAAKDDDTTEEAVVEITHLPGVAMASWNWHHNRRP